MYLHKIASKKDNPKHAKNKVSYVSIKTWHTTKTICIIYHKRIKRPSPQKDK